MDMLYLRDKERLIRKDSDVGERLKAKKDQKRGQQRVMVDSNTQLTNISLKAKTQGDAAVPFVSSLLNNSK